jgi:predicted transcriptional regulator
MATVHPKKSPLSELTAGEVMQPAVITVDRRTPIAEVERVFAEQRITGCPVTDDQGRIVGVISVRNLVERYAKGADRRPEGFYDAPSWDADAEYGARPAKERMEDVVEDVMSKHVFAVDKEAAVPEVARAMIRHSVHRLLVEHRGRYIGLVSSTDILRAVAALDQPAEA